MASDAYNYIVKYNEAEQQDNNYAHEKQKYSEHPTIVTFLFNTYNYKGLHGKWTHYYLTVPKDWKDMLKENIEGYPEDMRIYNINLRSGDGYESDVEYDFYNFEYIDVDEPNPKLYPKGQFPPQFKLLAL